MKKEILTIKNLLLIIVVPLVLYLLHILSFIFIPFVFGLFIALLFSPLMRWFKRMGVPGFLGVITVFIIVSLGIMVTYKLVHLSSNELTKVNESFKPKLDERLNEISKPIVQFMNINPRNDETDFKALLNSEEIKSQVFGKLGTGINIAGNVISMILMTLFFMVLFLAGTMDLQRLLELFIFKNQDAKINIFKKIEKDAFTYILIKTLISISTGVLISLSCYFFGISFPIFWGLVAFLLNFIQMIGSIVSVAALALFALVELSFAGSFVFFVAVIIGIQFILGNILEPILMGKSFSINTVAVLIMLAIWGFIWGIPGLILAVPISALLKRIFEQFPSTQIYAKAMS
ncbi:MAG TPA: AI-2E family transporter [Chitinophagaceae bacterium]|nr:AI-2E family transporter [Chitinophagaceae bacterium]